MHRLFLDANVLFSAAYRADSGLLRLGESDGAELVTSRYAMEEALRNLDTAEQRSRLRKLAQKIELVDEPHSDFRMPPDVDLPPKDVPILAAAISSGASHLVTGDRRDFGALFGTRVGGVLVLTPRNYLSQE